jgi:hypothetical protein
MPSELSIIRQFDRAMSHFAGVSNKSDEEIEKTSRLI